MRTHLKRKEVDDVLGGKESWANVDKIEGQSDPCLLELPDARISFAVGLTIVPQRCARNVMRGRRISDSCR